MKRKTLSAGAKVLIITLLTSQSFVVSAQGTLGRQKIDQYPITAWGTPTYGLTWLPTDYSNTNTKYPLIIFLHGSGEGGDGIGGLYNLLVYGLPNKIANGFNPEAVNPSDGKNYKFIVVSPQAPAAARWSYAWGSIQYILEDVKKRYRIDESRIYVTGISAGGAGSWSCVTNGKAAAQKFAAIVPVSAAGTNSSAESDDLPNVGSYGDKVWSITGASDAWLAFATTATNVVNKGAGQQVAYLTAVPGGHDPGAWNTPYDPNWRRNEQNLNIYEWMLRNTRGGNNNNDNNDYNQLPTANAGPDQTVTLPVSFLQLNGSGNDPDGSITDYTWTKVSGPAGGNFNNNDIANPIVTDLNPGTYIFRLTVTDDNGKKNGKGAGTGYDEVMITVRPAPVYKNLPGRIEAEDFSDMSGVQTENTGDAGGGQDVGWQEDNDWMDYTVSVNTAGNYTVGFRVATPNSGTQFQVRKADGSVLTTVTLPNTGSWQSWQTVSATIALNAGRQTLRIFTSNASGGWNINWMDFKPAKVNKAPVANAGTNVTITLPVNAANLAGTGTDSDGNISSYAWSQVNGPNAANFSNPGSASTTVGSLVQGAYTFRLKVTDDDGAAATSDVTVTVKAGAPPAVVYKDVPARIEAESYSDMSGIQTENTGDDDGGQNVGWQENNDWMEYAIKVPAAGTYTINFRVATANDGVQFQLKKSDGSILSTVTVPNTGLWQKYQTISTQVTLPAGQQIVRIVTTDAKTSGWNLNWWEVSNSNGNKSFASDAGDDQNLPSSSTSTTLNGNAKGANGAITYAWTEVTGPNNVNFATPDAAKTAVTGLVPGSYLFRLTVKDRNGNTASDELIVAIGNGTPSGTKRIEAESYTNMNGIQTENTSDAGGGKNVGWQENNDWMDYTVNVPSAGTYTLNFRVATVNTGVQFQLRNASGTVLTTVSVPNTGWWQTYQTVGAQVTLPAGQQTLRIVTTDAKGSGWNFNWWEIAGAVSTPFSKKIEAESFTSMNGIQTEKSWDDNTLNVGWQENNDWMDYSVNVPSAGTYTVNFRVATVNAGVQFQLRQADGSALTTVTIPNTGWWQTYQTVSSQVTLSAGQQTLRIVTTDAKGTGWNINWWEITNVANQSTVSASANRSEVALMNMNEKVGIDAFPNPVTDRFLLKVNNQLEGKMNVVLYNTSGAIQKQYSLNKVSGDTQTYLSIGDVPAGTYILKTSIGDWSESIKILKQ